MSRVVFIPAGDITNAGARMRAYWPARYMPNAAVVSWEEIRAGKLPEVEAGDAVIFQKLVDVGLMRSLRERGALVFWDVCDPAWWFNPTDAREAADVADAVVASSVALAADFNDWYGEVTARYINDRLDMDHFTQLREHQETRPVRFIWFGAAQNRVALYAAGALLARLRANGHEVTLTIFDNAPETPLPGFDAELPVYYTRWSLEREVEALAAHDIALLPFYPGPWGRVKSNNRQITAWAAGLPVVWDCNNYEMTRALVCDTQYRRETAAARLATVRRFYNVRQSAAEWLELIEEYGDGRTGQVRGETAVQVQRHFAQAGG